MLERMWHGTHTCTHTQRHTPAYTQTGQNDFHSLLVELQTGAATLEISVENEEFSKKLNINLSYEPVTQLHYS